MSYRTDPPDTTSETYQDLGNQAMGDNREDADERAQRDARERLARKARAIRDADKDDLDSLGDDSDS